ncbi:MAG: RNA-binding transcriptional accessory protein [Bacteroidetes bacterium]|nr:RNA-binding transcriptional accessory protein [Bacteroidota bacterium]
MNELTYIAGELGLPVSSVQATVKLLDEGATVPFISRYRREVTGGMDEENIRNIQDKLAYIRALTERKVTILASIEEQGKLTDELRQRVETCMIMAELEDIYLPYRPKRKTRASVAKEKGLEPLADLMYGQTLPLSGDKQSLIAPFVNPENGVLTPEEAVQGAIDIMAERISESADIRKVVREFTRSNGLLSAKRKDEESKERTDYENYYDFSDSLTKLKPYQVLAINRGEKELVLKVSVEVSSSVIVDLIAKKVISAPGSLFESEILKAVEDGYGRLIAPSIEREIRSELTENADLHAIDVFARNVYNLLLQPPLFGKTILGIDPGFVSGCKLAVVDSSGKYLEGTTIYPTEPKKWIDVSEKTLSALVKNHHVDVIAIGNGTASREVEQFVAETISKYNLTCGYMIVSEAGASVYSASKLAAEEFPDLEAAQRGNISIARRVLDPLAELVKIDPKSIGVGLYQHDVNQKNLEHKLGQVVESCVNHVGVNVNTASPALLSHVSGLNSRTATNIVRHRDEKGPFRSRESILDVKGMGAHSFEQSAGFLRITDGDNPLDGTSIHPESYPATYKLLEKLRVSAESIQKENKRLQEQLKQVNSHHLASELGIGKPTLDLIIENLLKPGRDPRADLPAPILRKDVLSMNDLKPGLRLKGTVRNVVDFGAFVDIGVKQDGLVHISEMGTSFVKNPHDVMSVGDVIEVAIKSVDHDRGRIALTMRLEGPSPKPEQKGRKVTPERSKEPALSDKLELLKQKFSR